MLGGGNVFLALWFWALLIWKSRFQGILQIWSLNYIDWSLLHWFRAWDCLLANATSHTIRSKGKGSYLYWLGGIGIS